MSTYIITGAARGLGLEFVTQLSAEKANTVFALVRSKSSAAALAELSRRNVIILEADITDADSLKVVLEFKKLPRAVAEATGGKVDYLINNAAIHDHSKVTLDAYPTPAAIEADLLENFRVNTLGTIHATNAFLPLLRAGSVKKVVTLTTGAADIDLTAALSNPGQAGYSISKAALNMAVAKFALALKGEGFVFLAISPGLVATATAPRTPEQAKEYAIFKEKLAKLAPDFKGPITPQVSVQMMLEVIYRWSVEDTGAFVSHHGSKEWL
ncbi:hypothetical protein B0H17DRAFT_1197305 [Mycena rosella]|uniref:Ketoreductase domain-containing protein n=1 Tax=Mycena rosella TaxID=1033263 RepID=A0AAD7DRW6_MYCRO|nr:hypothetical protein B0H17DRAFT_1197305 [Mycena rosella]